MTDWQDKQTSLDEESIISVQKRQKVMDDARIRAEIKRKELELKQVRSFLFVKRQELQRLNIERVHLEKQKISVEEGKSGKERGTSDVEQKIQDHEKELSRLEFELKQSQAKLTKVESELKNLENEEVGVSRSISHGERNVTSYSAQRHNEIKMDEVKRNIAKKKREVLQLKQEEEKIKNLISAEGRGNLRLRGILRLQKVEVSKVEQFEGAVERHLRSVNSDINVVVREVQELERKQKQLALEIQRLNYATPK